MTSEPLRVELRVSEDVEPGVYANLLSVWHSAHEFTLDFATSLPAVLGPEGPVQPARVTARVKLPPTVVFSVLRALNENLTAYEAAYGPVVEPGTVVTSEPPEEPGVLD
jgi:hypothetical protein